MTNPTRLRVLVACEFSGATRDRITALGHSAMSADLLPGETPGLHYQGDVRDVLDGDAEGRPWDLVIAHPPCTYLTNSGVRWLHTQEGRWALMREGAAFFRELLDSPADHVAVENPVMHGYAAQIVGRKADQIVQPYMFGELETKATGFWLRNLPPLLPTVPDVAAAKAATMALPVAQRSRIHYASPGPDRWKLRSVTYAGIADAMATQWTAAVLAART